MPVYLAKAAVMVVKPDRAVEATVWLTQPKGILPDTFPIFPTAYYNNIRFVKKYGCYRLTYQTSSQRAA